MKLTSFRIFVILIISITLLLAAAAGITYGASKLISHQGQTLVDAKIDKAVADSRQTSLLQAQADIVAYEELEDAAKALVPQEKDQARTVREILNIAAANKVRLKGITFPDSKLGLKSGKKTTPPDLTQMSSVKGMTGLYTMGISLSSSGSTSYDNFLSYVNDLQSNRRTANITNIAVTPDPDNRQQVSFTLSLNAYIKP